VVEASTLYRFCGQGVFVAFEPKSGQELKPALSYQLRAGSLRLAAPIFVQANSAPSFEKVKMNERGLYEA
jgi:hypothetical protein